MNSLPLAAGESQLEHSALSATALASSTAIPATRWWDWTHGLFPGSNCLSKWTCTCVSIDSVSLGDVGSGHLSYVFWSIFVIPTLAHVNTLAYILPSDTHECTRTHTHVHTHTHTHTHTRTQTQAPSGSAWQEHSNTR